jgi:hypothetical protein
MPTSTIANFSPLSLDREAGRTIFRVGVGEKGRYK